jgi:REP-associated tyrosine transposase
LVKDTGPNIIAQSMQLIAGRTAQEYNQRKYRQGAFWEDRYHATAIETDEHLHRCLVYIELNMVRAGVVPYPVEEHIMVIMRFKSARALRGHRSTGISDVV